MTTPSSSPSDAAPSTRRPAFPLWAWIVLLCWGLFQYADSLSPLPPGMAGRVAKAAEGRVDSDALQDMMQVDLVAKAAFAASLGGLSGGSANPDSQSLKEALGSAEDLEQKTHNSVSSVRRVIVLRALLGQPPFAVGKKSGAPLDAFGKDLSPALSPAERADLEGEGRIWVAALGPDTKPKDREKLAVQVRGLQNIRWWGAAGSAAVFKLAHNPAETARWNAVTRNRALPPLLGASVIGLFRGGLTLLGVGLLIALLVMTLVRRADPKVVSDLTSAPPLAPGDAQPYPAPPVAIRKPSDGNRLWKIEPPAVSLEARKITAGELIGVFLVYLLSREVISVFAVGFIGFGHAHLLHFTGFASQFQGQISRMSNQQHITLQVLAESVVYVITAIPPIVLLMVMARRRGASLADEIGWNVRAKGANVLYGAAGYAIASPLLIVVAWIGTHLFKGFANPANPVIPQVVGASGVLAPLVLVLLASVAAPFVEEILFRGVLMNAIFIRFGTWPSIVISGLIFGFVHPVGMAERLTISVLGIVFAWMAHTRQSLLPSMTAHFLNNFTTTLLLLAVMSG